MALDPKRRLDQRPSLRKQRRQMVCGGRYMEASNERVSDIRWPWAVSQINEVVNQALTLIEKDDTLNTDEKRKRLNDVEKSWQRILQG